MDTWLRTGCVLAAVWWGAILPTTGHAGEFAVSAQGTVTFREGDDEAFVLNRMNRGDNPFSGVRATVLGQATVNDATQLFLEIPIDASSNPSLFTTYLRPFLRLSSLGGQPWLNLQAGKLPTTFGTYGERTLSTETNLIGVPLLYFYHTALRADVIPADAGFFFQPGIRGRGHSFYSNGTYSSYVGMPLIYDACWDAGLEFFGTHNGLEFTLAATNGTVSKPSMRVENYNDGHSFIGRLGYRVTSGPLFGLRIGASGAFGPYLNAEVADQPAFPGDASVEDYLNTAIGIDLNYARGAWTFHSEAGRIGYEVPNIDPTLTATSYYVEVNRDLGPMWSVGLRQDGVLFSDLTSGGVTEGWDYDLFRWEAGISYRFRPGTRLRLVYQDTRFPDAEDLNAYLVAAQIQVWTR